MGAQPLNSTAIGPGGSIGVVLGAARGETLAGPGASWRALPALPQWTATLALGPGDEVDAIAAHAGTFSDYWLGPGTPAAWNLAQTTKVRHPPRIVGVRRSWLVGVRRS